MTARETYDLTGTIQGVGFRPAVFRLAAKFRLTGSVQNRTSSVRLVLEGPHESIQSFIALLPRALPPNAKMETVTQVSSDEIANADRAESFSILESSDTATVSIQIPPDLAICPDCLADISTPSNRRFGYPFTTCTNCGPRYTVVNGLPYDRVRTTMAVFPLCEDCAREYETPADRRFHAESLACPKCGPALRFLKADGSPVPGEPLQNARRQIAEGQVVAVRGIGGFLLAADPFNKHTIKLLRERKRRPQKPFALMVRDIPTLNRYCIVPPEAEELLTSPVAPIVILDINYTSEAERLPVKMIAPDTMTIGAMLPTSPLHRLLLDPLPGDPTPPGDLLLMTSGNRRNEPLCISNEEALRRLADIADFILTHDREINLRNDDSVCIIQHGRPQVWRRARGYAPDALPLPASLKRAVLAMGAEIKNTVAVGFDNRVVVSPHIGDLATPEALDSIESIANALPDFLQKMPQTVAVDLHPDMHSTRLGKKIALDLGIPMIEVQHHHAHAAACLAEHGHFDGLALVFDGTGLGRDGKIWGAEMLEISGKSTFRRIATFSGVALPGGDAAVNQPLRQLAARLADAGISVVHDRDWREELGITTSQAGIWGAQGLDLTNAPITHAAGRLFDSFSAILGFAPEFISYEGQPAICLEAAARWQLGAPVPEIPFGASADGELLIIDWRPAFQMLADKDFRKGRESELAMSAHHAIARAAACMVEYALSISPLRRVALSGGVFMNRILNELLIPKLREFGVEVLLHHRTPPNDGCISFGQAVIAGRK